MKNNKKIYAIYSEDKTDTADYSKMSAKERLKSRAFLDKSVIHLYCNCNDVLLNKTKDGRCTDTPGENKHHLTNCSRYKELSKPIDFTSDNIEIDIDINSLFPNKNKKKRKGSSSKKPFYKGTDGRRKYKTLSFVYPIAQAIYNLKKFKGKDYDIYTHVKALYKRLNEIKLIAARNIDGSNELSFKCGIFAETIDYEENEGLKKILFKCNGGIFSQTVTSDEFMDAKDNFERTYKKAFDSKLNLMFVCLNKAKDHRNNILFYPITNLGLPCDSFLEQEIYNRIEGGIAGSKKFYFVKDDYDSIYEKGLSGHLRDDGQIRYCDDNCKTKVVIEIFGVENDEKYSKKAKLKSKFLEEQSDVIPLKFYASDNEEEWKLKTKIAMDEFKKRIKQEKEV